MRMTFALCLGFVACGNPGTGDAGESTDAGTDAGSTDAGVDAGPPDAGPPDGGTDAGRLTPSWLLSPRGLSAAQLGVLVNANDPQSVAVADRYLAARGIPDVNRIELRFPVSDVMTLADFLPAKATVDARLDGGIQALAITWTSPYRVSCMSVTSAFALGFDAGAYCSTPCQPTRAVPTFDTPSHRLHADFGVLPTMMLAGADAGEAFRLIGRGVAADRSAPPGDGWFFRTSDPARSVRWPDFQNTVRQFAGDGGLALYYRDDGGVLTGATDVLFYFTGLASVPGIDQNAYRPGAVCDHLTSFGGQVPQSGQMSALRWLEAGATASYGTVVEPCNYTSKFPQTSVLVKRYFFGEPIIEAYWKSVAMPGEGLFIGEPLARPFDDESTSYEPSTQTLRLITRRLEPRVMYFIEGSDSEDGGWVEAAPPVSTPVPRQLTVEVTPATARYYRLRR